MEICACKVECLQVVEVVNFVKTLKGFIDFFHLSFNDKFVKFYSSFNEKFVKFCSSFSNKHVKFCSSFSEKVVKLWVKRKYKFKSFYGKSFQVP